MTASLRLVPGTEDRAGAVARRLREQIAGRRIHVGLIAARLNVSTMWVSRRTTGQTTLSVADLDMIEYATGISANYLFTGTGSPEVPVGPDGCAIRDSNPEPADTGSPQVAPHLRLVPDLPGTHPGEPARPFVRPTIEPDSEPTAA